MLPYLEYQSVYDHILTPGSGPETLAELQSTGIQVYTCPDDPNSDAGGTLSFVVNAGYTTGENWMDARGTGPDVPWTFGEHTLSSYLFSFNNYRDPSHIPDSDTGEVQAGTGVFVEEIGAKGYKARIDRIPDGTSHTILISENLQATNWYACNPREVGFVVPVANVPSHPTWYLDSVLPHGGIGPAPNIGGKTKALCYDTPVLGATGSAINADLGQRKGRCHVPSRTTPMW